MVGVRLAHIFGYAQLRLQLIDRGKAAYITCNRNQPDHPILLPFKSSHVCSTLSYQDLPSESRRVPSGAPRAGTCCLPRTSRSSCHPYWVFFNQIRSSHVHCYYLHCKRYVPSFDPVQTCSNCTRSRSDSFGSYSVSYCGFLGSIGRSQSKAQSSTEIPDFDYLGMVPSGAVPLAKAKLGERFVSRKVARGLWVQQKITIMGILADVEPNEKGFCMRCKAEGKPECLVLNRDSRINDLVFMSASCTTCIGAGQSCSSGIGDIDRQCYHQ